MRLENKPSNQSAFFLMFMLKRLKTHGTFSGHQVMKCHLIIKSEYIPIVIKNFKDVDVVDGYRVPGSVISVQVFPVRKS